MCWCVCILGVVRVPVQPYEMLSVRSANIVAGRYAYTRDLLQLGGFTGVPNVPSWPMSPTPVKVANWREFLATHPDQEYAAYIQLGFLYGFRIGFDQSSVSLRSSMQNHPSARENKAAVRDYIKVERYAGRLVGPFPGSDPPDVHISPIGLVPKSEPGQWRMIVDLSCPFGHSINDGVSSALSSLSYSSVDHVVNLILSLGKGTHLGKVDLKHAYRQIPVHPRDHHLLGIMWDQRVYIDRALPFGLRSAPKIFSAVSDMIAWAFYRLGIQYQVHYLDDFLFLEPPSTRGAASVIDVALRALDYLGFPVSRNKIEGPATCITFLGVLIDTEAFELRLPTGKLQRIRSLLRVWKAKKSCRRKELESLLGLLSHAATVVRPGRTFLRELFRLLHLTRAPHHFVRLTAGARADLAWWWCFLKEWSGSSFFPRSEADFHVWSDASGSFGCGAVVDCTAMFQLAWPVSWDIIDISVKELVPVVVAAALWGEKWRQRHVCIHSDNMAVVSVIKSGTTSSQQSMHLLRCLFFYCAFYRFSVSCVHVPGALNTVADALSRDNFDVVHSFLPQASLEHVPAAIVELLVTTRPDWGSPAWTDLFTRSLARELQTPR